MRRPMPRRMRMVMDMEPDYSQMRKMTRKEMESMMKAAHEEGTGSNGAPSKRKKKGRRRAS